MERRPPCERRSTPALHGCSVAGCGFELAEKDGKFDMETNGADHGEPCSDYALPAVCRRQGLPQRKRRKRPRDLDVGSVEVVQDERCSPERR